MRLLWVNKKIALLFLFALVILLPFFFRPAIAAGFFSLGEHYFEGYNYNLTLAEFFYRAAHVADSDLLGPQYQLARIEFLRGNFEAAQDYINGELRDHPDYARSYYVRGLIHGYAKRFDAAARDFQKFVEKNPQSWAGHNDLAWIYFEAGDYANAFAAARRGLAVNPHNPWLLNSAGIALLNAGDRIQARSYLVEAVVEAEHLTPEDWRRAYPGNDPRAAQGALREMVAQIRNNFLKAMAE